MNLDLVTKPGLARAFLTASALAATSCTLVLDAPEDQCGGDQDCAFLGERFTCVAAVCQSADSDSGGSECPAVAGYAWSESIAVVRNACELPMELSGELLTAGENEVEVSLPFELPFDVCLYGQRATNLWIGDNGYVAIGDGPPGATQADVGQAHSLGQPGVPGPGVAAFWDALQVGPRGVCVAVEGTEPGRTLWVTWNGACFEDGTGSCDTATSSLTFSVGFEEATGNILVGYPSMTGEAGFAERAMGQTAIIGITNAGARGCTADECNDAGVCADDSPCNYTEVSALTIRPEASTIEFIGHD